MENGTAPKPTSWKEVIEENIRLTDEWIAEGKFTCNAEMVYAQNMRHINDAYRRRREQEREGDDDPQAG